MFAHLVKHVLPPSAHKRISSRPFSACPLRALTAEAYRSLSPEAQRKHQEEYSKYWYYRSRYNNDPAFREAERTRKNKSYQARKHDPNLVRRYKLQNWLQAHPRVCDELPWKTHRPVFYNEKTEHFCSGCDLTRIHGQRLWWTSIGNRDTPQTWLCHGCYAKSGSWADIMPEGYEDIRTWRDLAKLKKQLDQVKSEGQIQGDVVLTRTQTGSQS